MTTLKYMRQEFKKLKWALYAVIFVFVALIFVQWGMGTDTAKKRGDYVAYVENERITYFDYIKALDRQREFLKQHNFSEETIKNLGEMVINSLIEKKLLKNQAKLLGFEISKEELKNEILKIPAFKREDGSFVGFEVYKNILAANQYTPRQFEEDLKEDILNNRYRKFISEILYIPEEEVIEEFKKRNLTLTADFIFYPFSNMEPYVQVEESEIKAYYEKIKDQFWQPEKRKISYLFIDFQKLKQRLSASEEEIRDYYDNNLGEFEKGEEVHARHILIKTEERGEEKAKEIAYEVLKKLKEGEDFSKLALEYSEDPGTKNKGGDLGYFGRGRMVHEFEEAAFSLEIGEFSEPIKTIFGYHIIQVLDKKEAGIRTLEEVKLEISSKVIQDKAETEALNKAKILYKRLNEEAPKKVEDLQKYTKEDPNVTLNTTNYFGLNDFIQGLGRFQELNNAVFALKLNGFSPPIKTSRGYVIAFLEDIKEQGLMPLSDVKGEVEKSLRKEKAKKLSENKLKEMEKLDFEEIAKKLNIIPSRDQTIRYLSPIPNLGNKRSLHEELFSYTAGSKTKALEGQNGWAIFYIKTKKEFSLEEFEKSRDEIINFLRQNISIQYVDILKEKAKQEVEILINPNYLKKST